jgi:peroxiredoxin
MLATFWLLGLVLGTSQTPTRPSPAAPATARADWILTPRLARGQELVYRGSFSEEAGSRVQLQRGYRFEVRYFVLDAPPKGVSMVALTTLHDRQSTATVRESTARVARLERIRLDLSGKATAEPGVSLLVPPEGAPTVEVGAFFELPRTRPTVGQTWETTEPNRPVMAWKLVGPETAGGQPCVKLVAVQQSDDWDRPRADRPAWRRVETVWVSPRTGLATRVERVIEQREPARTEVARKSVLRYELDSDLVYPARLAEDRRQEIQQAFGFRDAAAPMLTEPGKYAKQIPALQKRIGTHLQTHPPTPYREAVLAVKRSVDAAARGEVVKPVHHETAQPVITAATIGEPAPDFVATEVTGSGSGRLARWKGKEVLLCFYHPSSYTAAEMLRFAQEVQTSLGKHVQVVGLSVSDDSTAILKQQAELKVTFPILFGGGLRASYGVDSTPRLVVVDATGVVRAAYTGWGRETADEVLTEVKRWLPRP